MKFKPGIKLIHNRRTLTKFVYKRTATRVPFYKGQILRVVVVSSTPPAAFRSRWPRCTCRIPLLLTQVSAFLLPPLVEIS